MNSDIRKIVMELESWREKVLPFIEEEQSKGNTKRQQVPRNTDGQPRCCISAAFDHAACGAPHLEQSSKVAPQPKIEPL